MQPLDISAASQVCGAGAPEIMVSRLQLSEAIETELQDYFSDAFGPTLGRYEVAHIVGGIILRLVATAD